MICDRCGKETKEINVTVYEDETVRLCPACAEEVERIIDTFGEDDPYIVEAIVPPEDGEIFINQGGACIMSLHTLAQLTKGNIRENLAHAYIRVRSEEDGD